ncbi:MAG: hypothetical protein RR898_11185 [Clostridium sp.]|uniref:NADase-type glycan-binding domain-containing protein n=1 Tax=Clostridium sp. TaxID=1506 RepID=UPI002FCC8D7A
MCDKCARDIIMFSIICVTMIAIGVTGYLFYSDYKELQLSVTKAASINIKEEDNTNSDINTQNNINLQDNIKYIGTKNIEYVKASSYKKPKIEGDLEVYTAKSIIDGDIYTPWIEGKGGYGEGEWIHIKLKESLLIKGMSIYSGFKFKGNNSSEKYREYSRPKTIRIAYSNGTYAVISLKDYPKGDNVFRFKKPMNTEDVFVEILEVYPGSKYKDTCISEIKLF